MGEFESYLEGNVELDILFEADGYDVVKSESDLQDWANSIRDSIMSLGETTINEVDYSPGGTWTEGREYIGSIDFEMYADMGDIINISVVFLVNEVLLNIEGLGRNLEKSYDYSQFDEQIVFDKLLIFE